MTTLSLCILTAFSIVKIVRNRNSLTLFLPLFGTLIVGFSGLLGPIIWNWSRKYGTPGLLPSHYLVPKQSELFQSIFLWATLGCFVSYLIIRFISKLLERKYVSIRMTEILSLESIKNGNIYITFLGIMAIVLFFIGLGPSIWTSNVYLESNGYVTILRAVNAILPGIIILLSFGIYNRKTAKFNQLVLTLLFIMLLGKGSRLATLLLFVNLSIWLLLKFQSRLIRTVGFVCIFLLIQVTITMSFVAREGRNGILAIPNMFHMTLLEFNTSEGFVRVFGRTLASISSWVPTVITSINTTSSSVVISNLNPLIGSGSNPFNYSSEGIERLFPFTWIPLSSLGQLFGVGGGAIVFFTLLFPSLLVSISFIRIKSKAGEKIFALLAGGTYIYSFPLLYQYSTRILFRVFWLLLLLVVMHLIIAFRNKPEIEMR